MSGRPNFTAVNHAALANAEAIVRRWLPDGHRCGSEWIARNPRRNDRHLGSFKVNLHSGKWADFATGEKGGDLISLAAWLFDLSQTQAAEELARMLGVPDVVA